MPRVDPWTPIAREAAGFVVTSHERPDGDAIGSAMAMALALRALGKQATVVTDAVLPAYLQPFPDVGAIRITTEVTEAFDAALIMECSELARTGVKGLDRSPVINIDHHPGNTGYGALNWFDESAAACGEMVFTLIEALGVPAVAPTSRRTSTWRSSPTPARSISRTSRRAPSRWRGGASRRAPIPQWIARHALRQQQPGPRPHLRRGAQRHGHRRRRPRGAAGDHAPAAGRPRRHQRRHRRPDQLPADGEGDSRPWPSSRRPATATGASACGRRARSTSARSPSGIRRRRPQERRGLLGHRRARRRARHASSPRLLVDAVGPDRSPDGVLVVDKPQGPTSHDVVAVARRALGESRIGHTGTLDPLATGVLPLVVGTGDAPRAVPDRRPKDYDATVRFGQTTDTYDATGTPGAHVRGAAHARRPRRGPRAVSRHVRPDAARLLGQEDRRRARLRTWRGAAATGPPGGPRPSPSPSSGST